LYNWFSANLADRFTLMKLPVVFRKVRSAFWLLDRKLQARRERLEKAPLYTSVHGQLDPEVHLREAAAWLCRAQDHGVDRGISYGAKFGQDFLTSYPETTGYIIRTLIDLARHYRDESYLDRAVKAGQWEVSVQMECGAAGNYLGNPIPAVFDTGMVLLGWSALLRNGSQDRFAPAARKAADWLVSIQEPNGHWIRGNDCGYNDPVTTTYNVKSAWGLSEIGQVLGETRYLEAAVRNAEYALTRQLPNGWYEDCCLTDAARPLLHTIAYAAQGLLGIGKVTGRRDFIDAASRTADSLLKAMDPDGYIPGRLDLSFRPAANWCCLTGTAQTSIVWSELAAITGRQAYIGAAERANRYLMARHDISNPDPRIRGGLAGSWPVWGEYGRLTVLNWATKFLADALLLRMNPIH
jgi:hypothetical protein